MEREVWKTRDGRQLFVKNMTTEHVSNTMYMLKRTGQAAKEDGAAWINRFREELIRHLEKSYNEARLR